MDRPNAILIKRHYSNRSDTMPQRISLNWPLDAQGDIPFFGRQVFHKHVYQKAPRIVHDDTWTFNTQSSSQWDGLRHFAYQKAERFYNNVTLEQITGPEATNVNGIGAWSEQGIVGRGVLLDYAAWAETQGRTHDAFQKGSLALEDLKKVADWEGVEIKFGDVLIIRSGQCRVLNFACPGETASLIQVLWQSRCWYVFQTRG